MSGEQLRLDLDDRKQYLAHMIETTWLGSGQGWRVFCRKRLSNGSLFLSLGIRTHGPVETDYEYLERVTLEEAEWLTNRWFTTSVDEKPVRVLEHLEALKRIRRSADG